MHSTFASKSFVSKTFVGYMLSKRDATRGGNFFSALLKLKSWNIACDYDYDYARLLGYAFLLPPPTSFTRFLFNFAYIKALIFLIVVHHEIQYIPASSVDAAL